MKKHLSIKLFIAVLAISIYSYMVFKSGKSLNSTEQASLSSEAPQPQIETESNNPSTPN